MTHFIRNFLFCFAIAVTLLLTSAPPLAAPPDVPTAPIAPAAPNTTDEVTPHVTLTPEEKAARITKAAAHFKRGVEFFKKKDCAAAVAEFFASMNYAPLWNSTWFAARCLKQLRRYDESLAMFETLFRDYERDLSKKDNRDRELIRAEWDQLRQMVGFIDIIGAEFDAGIRIDGRNRGVYPSPAPHRVATGFHTVRVYKEGYEPFETNVDVAGNQVQTILAQLRKLDLDQAGMLRVSEANQRVLDVVIDGSVVGQTPWEGHLREGEHSVVLEGVDDWGTQPTTVPLKKGDNIPLVLNAEQLEANVKIIPTPVGATVAIDKVSVGRGVWQGKVRRGIHRVEIAADGYVLHTNEVSFIKGTNDPMVVTLERDPLSPLWKDNRGRVYVEAAINPGITPTFGGDVLAGCGDGCSQWVGLAANATARAGYRFPSGFFLGIDAGYFYARQRVTDRTATITPYGLDPETGTVNDTLSLRGAMVGAAAGIRLGKKTPISIRLSVGTLLGGQFRDHRTGEFMTNERTTKRGKFLPTPYSVDTTQLQSMFGLYLAPEVSLGLELAERLHVQAGVNALVLLMPTGNALTWKPNDSKVDARTSGLATFGPDALIGAVTLFLSPSASLRYEF